MKHQIKVLDTVIQRLKNLDNPCFGKIFGIFAKNTLFILGLQLENENIVSEIYGLPAEVDFCGIFQAYSTKYETQDIIKKCASIEVTDNPVILLVKLTIQNDIHANVVSNNTVSNTDYIVVNKYQVYSQFLHIRLQGDFQINGESNNESSITESFTALRKNVASGVFAFILSKLNIILLTSDCENAIVGLSDDPPFGEICQQSNEEGGQKKKKQDQILELDVINMDMIKRVSKDLQNSETKGHSPVVVLDKKQVDLLTIPIKIDFLAAVHRETKLSKVYNILLEGAIRYLKLYESIFKSYLNKHQIENGLKVPDTVHFFPQDCGHFLTRIIFNTANEEMKQEREILHGILLLNKSMPLFRKSNQFQFSNSEENNGPLKNVHEGLKPTINGGKICLVKGNYEYYHYCQNQMDDNGWGCAYRSLQTLASWFKLQGYIDVEVPTFKEIQKCLVDIGDKPSSFVDSRQWIGSTEVSFVLNSLLGVTSRIIYVNSGEEMATKGPELVHHFETQSTPVMIGGGVLAHTILGVDYNQETGNLKFLILDPHYTGREDLNLIQSKGWCGWKNVDFWNKTAYYNMCLPQVSREL